MAETAPPAVHLPTVASAEAQVRLHEAAAGALRRFAKSDTIPVSRPVAGSPEPAAPVPKAVPHAPVRRTLGELAEEFGLTDEDVPRPVVVAKPARPALTEADGWSPADVLRRTAPAKGAGRSGAALAAGALAQMQIPKSR